MRKRLKRQTVGCVDLLMFVETEYLCPELANGYHVIPPIADEFPGDNRSGRNGIVNTFMTVYCQVVLHVGGICRIRIRLQIKQADLSLLLLVPHLSNTFSGIAV